MKSLSVKPGKPLNGEIGTSEKIGYPGDKSISHRAVLFAAMAEGESRIENFQVSGVTRPMLTALSAAGIDWTLEGTCLSVKGRGFSDWKDPKNPILCGNSATTMRLLAGCFAAVGIEAILDGSPGLRRRPMDRIVEPLRKMGVKVIDTDGCAPLHLNTSKFPLKGGEFELSVASAQVKSCILLAGLQADCEVVVIEPSASRDHTERMLGGMGIEISIEKRFLKDSNKVLTVLNPPAPVKLRPLEMEVPGDFSAVAFLIVAACITPGSDVLIRGTGLNPTRTGLLDALIQMGASIEISNQKIQSGEPVGDLRIRFGTLKGITIQGDDVVRMIDEFPAFAIAATFSEGTTIVKDAIELRYKESDRIADLCRELHRLGVEIAELPDGFQIDGRESIQGGSVDPKGDHRLAMAFALSGLRSQKEVVVSNPEIIQESFPMFVQVLKKLGADILDG